MVKINKSELPQDIVIDNEKDYRSEKVISILRKDFYNKCYICEEKKPTSINVEHLHSCKNNRQLKYKWENLFYACNHCNKIKGSQYDDIIDCTKDDPEKYILIKFKSYPEKNVEILDKASSPENKETQELLYKIYNGMEEVAISTYEAKNLKNKIADEIKDFMGYVESYCDEADPKLQAVYWDRIKIMLNRESNFAGFKRSIVMQDKKLMEYFKELLI